MKHGKYIACGLLATAVGFTASVGTANTNSRTGNHVKAPSAGGNSRATSTSSARDIARVKWKSFIAKGVPSKVALSKQVVFVVVKSDDNGTDVTLFAFAARDGKVKWHRVISHGDQFPTNPAVDNEGNIFVTTREGCVVSYSGTTGTPLWTFRADGRAEDLVDGSSPVLIGDMVYVSFGWRHMYALDRKTGVKVWRNDAYIGGPVAPAVYDGHHLVAFVGNELAMIDALSGSVLWRQPTGPGGTAPTCTGERVYRADGYGRLSSWKAETGKLIWTTERLGRALEGLTDSNGVVLTMDTDFANESKLIAVNAVSGRLKWTYSIKKKADVFPEPGPHQQIYVVNAPQLLALDANSRKPKWKVDLNLADRPFSSSVTVGSSGSIYVANGDTGILYAVE